DFGPGFEVEALQADALLLLIAREGEFRRQLQADEALEVVRAGVDEVADGLLRGPLAGSARLGGDLGGEVAELALGAREGGAEIRGEGLGSDGSEVGDKGIGHGVGLLLYPMSGAEGRVRLFWIWLGGTVALDAGIPERGERRHQHAADDDTGTD